MRHKELEFCVGIFEHPSSTITAVLAEHPATSSKDETDSGITYLYYSMWFMGGRWVMAIIVTTHILLSEVAKESFLATQRISATTTTNNRFLSDHRCTHLWLS
eukprot:m.949812 g.949812  ORF g.949812 m.949812 type:complete len:103 (-) comp23858_c0_seq6:994-1302(-)